ncbi:TonB-dependent receptor plug domain-containing protein [Roseivirga sp. BDSF3-8]|uniref:TonB-dependent receptor plug domain-containing protein n=1 Tax=Roseivirga sp. BDSF3-8 TaxID=3241598 RepID=UPI0035324D67
MSRIKYSLAVALAIVFTGSVRAQSDFYQNTETDSTGTIRLQEVEVTARKFPYKTLEQTKNLTVITNEEIKRSQGLSLSEVLDRQAGITINGAYSSPGKNLNVYVRGADPEYTLITVDGVPLYDPSGIGSNFDLRFLPLEQIERIEILKGGQSVLYGTDAIAGVINIITKKAEANGFSPYATLSYGSFNTWDGAAGVRGSAGKVDYHVGYSMLDTDGISEAVSEEESVEFEEDGFTRQTVQANVGLQATPALYISPFVRYSRFDGDLDQSAFVDELDYTYEFENYQLGLRGEWQTTIGEIKALYSYNHTYRFFEDDSTLSQNGFSAYSNGKYIGDEHFADIYLNHPISSDLELTVGVDYRGSSTEQYTLSVSEFGPFATSLEDDSVSQSQVGIYTALFYNRGGEGFSTEAGLRGNRHSVYGENLLFNFSPSYNFGGGWSLFANVARAFRAPSLYQLYSEYSNPAEQLDAETAMTYDGGVQYIQPQGRFSVRASAFYRDVNDVIAFDLTNYVYVNRDRQLDRGIELEPAVYFGNRAKVAINYTYLKGEIEEEGLETDTTYLNLYRRPEHSVSANVEYQVTDALLISSNVQWNGERQDAGFNETFDLEPYFLLNVHAQYRVNSQLSLFFRANNLLDEQFTEVRGYGTRGRNISGGFSFQL